MSSESRTEEFHDLLMNLEVISGIIGTAIVKSNGLLITSRLPRDIDDRKFGAMAATMLGAIETAINALGTTNIRVKTNIEKSATDFRFIFSPSNASFTFICELKKRLLRNRKYLKT